MLMQMTFEKPNSASESSRLFRAEATTPSVHAPQHRSRAARTLARRPGHGGKPRQRLPQPSAAKVFVLY